MMQNNILSESVLDKLNSLMFSRGGWRERDAQEMTEAYFDDVLHSEMNACLMKRIKDTYDPDALRESNVGFGWTAIKPRDLLSRNDLKCLRWIGVVLNNSKLITKPFCAWICGSQEFAAYAHLIHTVEQYTNFNYFHFSAQEYMERLFAKDLGEWRGKIDSDILFITAAYSTIDGNYFSNQICSLVSDRYRKGKWTFLFSNQTPSQSMLIPPEYAGEFLFIKDIFIMNTDGGSV